MLIQKTMSSGSKACEYFLKIFQGWECCALDANCFFGGLLSISNPSLVDFRPYNSPPSISLEGRIRGFVHLVKVVNCYAPYVKREEFWNKVDIHAIIQEDFLFYFCQ